jgi:hypothetical protein
MASDLSGGGLEYKIQIIKSEFVVSDGRSKSYIHEDRMCTDIKNIQECGSNYNYCSCCKYECEYPEEDGTGTGGTGVIFSPGFADFFDVAPLVLAGGCPEEPECEGGWAVCKDTGGCCGSTCYCDYCDYYHYDKKYKYTYTVEVSIKDTKSQLLVRDGFEPLRVRFLFSSEIIDNDCDGHECTTGTGTGEIRIR